MIWDGTGLVSLKKRLGQNAFNGLPFTRANVYGLIRHNLRRCLRVWIGGVLTSALRDPSPAATEYSGGVFWAKHWYLYFKAPMTFLLIFRSDIDALKAIVLASQAC
jgi:hypothetical protein